MESSDPVTPKPEATKPKMSSTIDGDKTHLPVLVDMLYADSYLEILTEVEMSAKISLFNDTRYPMILEKCYFCDGSRFVLPPPPKLEPGQFGIIGHIVDDDWDSSWALTGSVTYTLLKDDELTPQEVVGETRTQWKVSEGKPVLEKIAEGRNIVLRCSESDESTTTHVSFCVEVTDTPVDSSVSLSKKKLTSMESTSNFDNAELRELYTSFRLYSVPGFNLPRKKWAEIFPKMEDPLLSMLFDHFAGSSKDDGIPFANFVAILSIMSRGTFLEQADLLFHLIDTSKDGRIQRSELKEYCYYVQEFMNAATGEEDFCNVNGLVDNVFAKRSHPSVKLEQESFSASDMEYRDEDSETEVEPDSDYSQSAELFEEALSRSEFIHLIIHEPDLISSFGLWDYLTNIFVTPIEKKCQRNKSALVVLCGMLEKSKKDKLVHTLHMVSKSNKRYFAIQGRFLCYYHNESSTKIQGIYPLWTATIKSAPSESATHFHINMPGFKRKIWAKTPKEARRWADTLRNSAHTKFRHSSFALVRKINKTEYLLNGQEYFQDVIAAFEMAKSRIYISDWHLSPGLYLRRGGMDYKKTRLDRLIFAAAERGVEVYILVFFASSMAFDLQAQYVKDHFNDMHPNIYAVAIPNTKVPLLWSHHQKIVVADEVVAWLGGIDLCYGRYDTAQYRIQDENGEEFPGRDYVNIFVNDESNGPTSENTLDRSKHCRMPWRDVQMRVAGMAAYDVTLNFIQCWNYATKTTSTDTKPRYILPLHSEMNGKLVNMKRIPQSSGDILTSKPVENPAHRGVMNVDELEWRYTNCQCQVLRSLGTWSTGGAAPEHSIYKAYIHLIQTAKYYIYIENQYFISSIDSASPKNRILDALYQRIKKAITYQTKFRVMIVLPVYPGGSITSVPVRYMAKYTYRSINRGGDSLLEKLAKDFPGVDLSEYVQFFTPRQKDLDADGLPITEAIYVHAKMMIVDDCHVIIGSANINDRSMRGTRDAEIAILTEQFTDMEQSYMDGELVSVSKFAHDLRLRQWCDLLNCGPDTIIDPISDEVWGGLLSIAHSNTELYLSIFATLPDNTYVSSSATKKMGVELNPYENKEELLNRYNKIQGILTLFPYDFLKDETITIGILQKEYVLPRAVFL